MITLNEFLDMWTRKNLAVVICSSADYDEMFDSIDDINDGKISIEDISEYVTCAIIPYYCEYRAAYYLKEKWSEAIVTYFYIGTTAVIVWVDDEKAVH